VLDEPFRLWFSCTSPQKFDSSKVRNNRKIRFFDLPEEIKTVADRALTLQLQSAVAVCSGIWTETLPFAGSRIRRTHRQSIHRPLRKMVHPIQCQNAVQVVFWHQGVRRLPAHVVLFSRKIDACGIRAALERTAFHGLK